MIYNYKNVQKSIFVLGKKSSKLPKMQFHEKKSYIINFFFREIDLFDLTSFVMPGLFKIFWPAM